MIELATTVEHEMMIMYALKVEKITKFGPRE